MIDIHAWLEVFCGRLEKTFSGRVWFTGLQGSYARGEAKDTSDIDIVVIFDKLTADDLLRYRAMLDTLPEREKICGFVSGRDELMHWEASDLFQFCYDTVPIMGSLDEVFALLDKVAVRRAVLAGACNIYHGCVHNFLHERDAAILKGLCKSAAFVIQAEYFMNTGRYVRSHRELSALVSHEEREILCPDYSLGIDELSEKLFLWAGRKITGTKNEA
ncbi:MAG: nucleotidyltransferase domain-containing protein [Synergistaceae bacterium]|nr:nucleotidyltransferase domain-containing protein [Synergistaceae bacterium]